VYSVGSNSHGNLGIGNTTSSDVPVQVLGGVELLKIKQIAAGRHSAAISEDGRLFIWGSVFVGLKPLLVP